MYDTDYREAPCAAVDTAYALTAQGADTPGAFIVPSTASMITALRIFVSGIVTDVVTGSTIAVQIQGSGLRGVGDGWFVGPLLSCAGAAATSGGFDYRDGMIYKTRIPVVPGAPFNATAYINGEDAGTAHVLLEVEYDGVPGLIVDGDYREGDIGAAANTLVNLTARGPATDEGDFRPAGRTIGEIVFGAALDPTGDAANGLVFAPALHLTGNGLVNAGNYNIVGPSGPTQPDTDVSGGQQVVCNPTRRICGSGIATKANGTIRAQAQNIESINAGHAIVGFLYI